MRARTSPGSEPGLPDFGGKLLPEVWGREQVGVTSLPSYLSSSRMKHAASHLVFPWRPPNSSRPHLRHSAPEAQRHPERAQGSSERPRHLQHRGVQEVRLARRIKMPKVRMPLQGIMPYDPESSGGPRAEAYQSRRL